MVSQYLTTRPFLSLSEQPPLQHVLAAQKQPYFLSWCSWGLLSTVYALLDSVLFSWAKSEVSRSPQGYRKKQSRQAWTQMTSLSQKWLQMETESHVGSHSFINRITKDMLYWSKLLSPSMVPLKSKWAVCQQSTPVDWYIFPTWTHQSLSETF